MAEIPLRLISWVYDEETNRVEASFEDAPTADYVDPASHRSTKFFRIEILPQSVESEERTPAVPPASSPTETTALPSPEGNIESAGDTGGPAEVPVPPV